ncbi:MAG TPA: phospholipid-binding protein [Verrucomicrobiales bacterium]|nr:phospholipid-binding protein [Verrucomicrobiales bacterium]
MSLSCFDHAPGLRRIAGLFLLAMLLGLTWESRGHDIAGGVPHSREPVLSTWVVALADAPELSTPSPPERMRPSVPPQAEGFVAFAPRVRVRWDDRFVYVEGNGLPAHGMMEGITAWQQQVPLPQPYRGENAWRIPLHPVPAHDPVSIRGRFLRGAVAVAVNGIPIFNPQNNRGEISQEIGELDRWGGHCGRADDYHYHIAPLHLQAQAGPGRPIAYALDGYPIFGLVEPDGAAVSGLDPFNGHTSSGTGYHYHASTHYPYVNGGFHGEVVESEGQVAPQPRARPVRPDLPPLRGARIVRFSADRDEASFELEYQVGSSPGKVAYRRTPEGGWRFEFLGTDGSRREEVYPADRRNGLGPGGARRQPDVRAGADAPPAGGTFRLRSPAMRDGGRLPVEFTGDGAGDSPPLEWGGAPAGTRSFALIMHHIDPEGIAKWYWILHDIPPDVQRLPRNATRVGVAGENSIDRRIGYAPPHSKGPGPKEYTFTLYALDVSTLPLPPSPSGAGRPALLAAMRGRILGTAELSVVYARPGTGEPPPPGR